MKQSKKQLTAAVADAMTDFIETGGDFTPYNPAVMYDEKQHNYYYGSALHDDTVIIEFVSGFGSWEPTKASDIPSAAAGLVTEIISEANAV